MLNRTRSTMNNNCQLNIDDEHEWICTGRRIENIDNETIRIAHASDRRERAIEEACVLFVLLLLLLDFCVFSYDYIKKHTERQTEKVTERDRETERKKERKKVFGNFLPGKCSFMLLSFRFFSSYSFAEIFLL
jgi:hypothetical protein